MVRFLGCESLCLDALIKAAPLVKGKLCWGALALTPDVAHNTLNILQEQEVGC
jgi:hypothetical protein